MNLVGGLAARCAGGHHQWEPVDVLRRPSQREERCRGCGAHGVWMSAADAVRDAEWGTSRITPPSLLSTSHQ